MRISDWSSDVCSSDLTFIAAISGRSSAAPCQAVSTTPCRAFVPEHASLGCLADTLHGLVEIIECGAGSLPHEGKILSNHHGRDAEVDQPFGLVALHRLHDGRHGFAVRLCDVDHILDGVSKRRHRRSDEHTSELKSL